EVRPFPEVYERIA
nr:RecName: Full=Snake venom vascular endothelial growth factor toxin IC1; Short=svVEGF; AltName: Full=Increasing capillary-1; AltName: Full=VEGF-F [Macrovipera lebetina]